MTNKDIANNSHFISTANLILTKNRAAQSAEKYAAVEYFYTLWLFLGRIACTQCMRCGLLLQMSHVAWSVCLYAGHTGELCKNGWTDRDAVRGRADLCGYKEPYIKWRQDRTNSLEAARGVKTVMWLLSNYTLHLLITAEYKLCIKL